MQISTAVDMYRVALQISLHRACSVLEALLQLRLYRGPLQFCVRSRCSQRTHVAVIYTRTSVIALQRLKVDHYKRTTNTFMTDQSKLKAKILVFVAEKQLGTYRVVYNMLPYQLNFNSITTCNSAGINYHRSSSLLTSPLRGRGYSTHSVCVWVCVCVCVCLLPL